MAIGFYTFKYPHRTKNGYHHRYKVCWNLFTPYINSPKDRYLGQTALYITFYQGLRNFQAELLAKKTQKLGKFSLQFATNCSVINFLH